MEFNLPKETFVNKFIPKNKFFEKANVSNKIKIEFQENLKKITWKYKLSEDTINTKKTQNVSEIQIFEIELKEKIIPKKVLKIIDSSIQYNILYIFTFEDDFSYGITLKRESGKEYYFSEWNEEKKFNFSDINLENIYQNIIKEFIVNTEKENKKFEEIIKTDKRFKELEKEIQILKNKIKNEKQFNKKIIFNEKLNILKKEFENLN